MAKSFSEEEKQKARELSAKWGVEPEESYSISFVGTSATLNDATINGMERAAKFLISRFLK